MAGRQIQHMAHVAAMSGPVVASGIPVGNIESGSLSFGPNQMERWLAAEPVALANGVANTITLRAKQPCAIDLSRLVLQATPKAEAGVALTLNPFNQNLNDYCYIQSIVVRGATEIIQGKPAAAATAVDVPLGFFAPGRDLTIWRPQGQGHWIGLAAQDTVAITVIQTSGLAGELMAACPTVLKCDENKIAYPANFNQHFGSFALGSTQSGATAVGAAVNLSLELNIPGILNWNQLIVAGDVSTAAFTSTGGVTRKPYDCSSISSMTDFAGDEYVQGVPDVAGNDLAVPLSAYMPPGTTEDRAGFPWVRLPALAGTSGNEARITIQTVYPIAGVNFNLSAGAPFFAAATKSREPLACQ
jgi:hypothetical protein